MTLTGKINWTLIGLLLLILLIVPVQTFAKKSADDCPGNSCNAPGQNKNIATKVDSADVQVEQDDSVTSERFAPGQVKKLSKGRSGVKGNLKTSQHIYYEGDTIEVSIKFSRGWEPVADGEIDAHVVLITPDGEVHAVPVDSEVGPEDRRFFTFPLETGTDLPVGQYQLALVLTVPEGDPLIIVDWFNGFRGLVDMEGLYISDEALPEDIDMDGECDFDEDGDGFCDEENGTDDDDDDDSEDEES